MKEYKSYNFDGFLWLHDDMVPNMRKISNFEKNVSWVIDTGKYWTVEPWSSRNFSWFWLNGNMGIDSMNKLLESRPDFSSNLKKCTGHIHNWFIGQSDFVYLSKEYIDELLDIVGLFSKYRLFLEIAIPTFMYCFACDKEKCQKLKLCTSFGKNRLSYYRECDNSFDLYHPVKGYMPEARSFVMEKVITR